MRFLQRATFGGRPSDIDQLLAIGIDQWLDDQVATGASGTHLDRRIQGGNLARSVWETYLGHADQLRKRWAYALSQIFVVSDVELSSYDVAAYADLLEANCFGTYRNLLETVTRSVAMGEYLTYERNRKEDTRRGRVPDENYAREVMQLLSIGLWELNPDGTHKKSGGQSIPTYDTADILGLARVFTGFEAPDINDDPTRHALPMESTGDFADRYHETGEKTFLGTTIPASETRTLDESLAIALDTLANHPNVGPFISHQLIQRLVTSNPTPSYVARVAAVFDNDGSGVRGNLEAVLRSIVLDDEAWLTSPAPAHGKLREPVLRFTTLARALDVTSTGTPWAVSSYADSATELGQQPFESLSVFNFYRPGYVPPQSALGDAGLAAPEVQIANETTMIAWANFVARFLRRPPGRTYNGGTPQEYRVETMFDVADLVDLIDTKSITATEAGVLVDEVTARLCPQGISPAIREIAIRRVVEVYDDRYDPARTEDYHVRRRDDVHLDRVIGAVMMIAVSTDFLHER